MEADLVYTYACMRATFFRNWIGVRTHFTRIVIKFSLEGVYVYV